MSGRCCKKTKHGMNRKSHDWCSLTPHTFMDDLMGRLVDVFHMRWRSKQISILMRKKLMETFILAMKTRYHSHLIEHDNSADSWKVESEIFDMLTLWPRENCKKIFNDRLFLVQLIHQYRILLTITMGFTWFTINDKFYISQTVNFASCVLQFKKHIRNDRSLERYRTMECDSARIKVEYVV